MLSSIAVVSAQVGAYSVFASSSLSSAQTSTIVSLAQQHLFHSAMIHNGVGYLIVWHEHSFDTAAIASSSIERCRILNQ